MDSGFSQNLHVSFAQTKTIFQGYANADPRFKQPPREEFLDYENYNEGR